jgi:hypothetical protein
MPIDTPYNRKVAAEFNKMNRAKISYLDHSLQDVVQTPVGKFAIPAFSGSNMMMNVNKTVGSGMAPYIKGGAKPCPKGHSTCTCNSCGGNNPGVNFKTRMELNLGAGRMNESIPDHLVPNTSAGNPSMTSNTNAYLSGGVKPKESGMRSNSGAGTDGRKARAELVKKIMKEKGMKMTDASKYIKDNGLYKK